MSIAVVTGAGSGIGRAVATALAGRGDVVVCADLDVAAAAATAEQLAGAEARVLDVRSSQACDSLIADVAARHGGVDVLVTCAGIERTALAHELTDEAFSSTIEVNLHGTFYAARAAAREMIRQGRGGRMVLVGSINSEVALAGQAAYCSSKGAVLMLGRALAVDWARYEIAVNVVAPGVTDTPMSAASLADASRKADLLSRIPLRRPARPSEIAAAVGFLTSSEASYVTGACLAVDGGWLAG